MRFLTKASVLAIALVLPGVASAATFTLNLTGIVSNGTFNDFDIGTSHFRTFNLALSSFDPILLTQGDVINATITLDRVFTVPASGEQFVGLNFFQGNFGSPPDPDTTNNSGTTTYFNSTGPTGRVSDTALSGCGNCLSAITFQAPGGAFSFDSLHISQTITGLAAPFTIDNASLSYQLRDLAATVPEPGSWAMMISGFGLLGGALRRRRVSRPILA